MVRKKKTKLELFDEFIINYKNSIIDKFVDMNEKLIIEELHLLFIFIDNKKYIEFKNKFSLFLEKYKENLIIQNIYDSLYKSNIEFTICVHRNFESFLWININCNKTITEIVDEINNCLLLDNLFYNDCLKLECISSKDSLKLQIIKNSIDIINDLIENIQ